ncbi:N-acetylneuraminate epimerase [Photobacterium carnosum]|uniref:N-acetylneuraminate epimerase n=1 Tax=Photobacterium carnosum TaxID=2023717 RepID=UPI001E49F30F|nr:N-acetylneuraminate epimerase [Photobacterium carnosum]MCD9496595.1 YjhT family mutarotase [Photobacterium carnosum]MCD9527830.1 YjhT family mutarotase [Photobacterium carnosum]
MNKKFNIITKSLLILSLSLSSSAFASNHWPDLPIGLKSGISAQVGDKIFVGLGSAELDFYMLDLNDMKKGWQKKANFTGSARSGSTASVLGNDIYVFGGSGKNNASDVSPVLFESVYRYNVKSDSWSQMNTTSPVGLLGAASYSPDGKQIVFFGGYNKPYFDQYLSDVNTIDQKSQPNVWQKIVDDYMGMKPLDYKWNRQILSFNPLTGKWNDLGMSPYIPNCDSALIADGNKATLISGEIKPGLRTPEVKQYKFGQPQPWTSQTSLPAPRGSQVQEGVAGAFAGMSNDTLIIAGGANFHGARLAFEQGEMFAHNGFGKAYNPEMYVQQKGLWSQVNDLPEGLAYGASLSIPNGVLIAGGEKSDRSVSKKVYLLTWNGSTVNIQD